MIATTVVDVIVATIVCQILPLRCWQAKPEWGQDALKQQKSVEGLPEEAAADEEEEEEEE